MPITPHGHQCTHRDPETGERCITRLCAYNEGPECFSHAFIEAVPRPEMERVAYDYVMRQIGAGERIAA